MGINKNKKEFQRMAKEWFVKLQNLICKSVEDIEKEYGSNAKFKKNKWKRGEFRIIKGEVIEKGGVAFSNVIGKFPKNFAKEIPGTNKDSGFWSSGVSVVFHAKNPNVPSCHFNTRFICTEKSWFGGGMDLTPDIKDHKQIKLWHDTIKEMYSRHNKSRYPKHKKWCDEYFYHHARKEPRGVGGNFFDYLKDNSRKEWGRNFEFVKDNGTTFAELIKAMWRPKMNLAFTKKDKDRQLIRRGKYAEYNLLYDRGTKFGLNSGGNPEAILMSMPPQAKWL